MSRSSWKGDVCLKGITSKNGDLFFGKIRQKNAVITPDLVLGSLDVIGSGKGSEERSLRLMVQRVGHRFGEFVFTRSLVMHHPDNIKRSRGKIAKKKK